MGEALTGAFTTAVGTIKTDVTTMIQRRPCRLVLLSWVSVLRFVSESTSSVLSRIPK